jgi:large subunit ribosomal protein L10
MSPKKLNPAKVASVAELKKLVSESKSIAVVDYRGLKVSQATQLRRSVRKAGGKFVVTKNTLFSIAFGHSDLKLEGLSAFIFSQSDEISAIKAVADFSKNPVNAGIPVFKLGFLSDRILSKDEVIALASLPSKQVLVAQTLGSLNSPLYRLVNVLNGNISKLVRTLDAIKTQKGGD